MGSKCQKCGADVNDFTVDCSVCGDSIHTKDAVIKSYEYYLNNTRAQLAESKALLKEATELLEQARDICTYVEPVYWHCDRLRKSRADIWAFLADNALDRAMNAMFPKHDIRALLSTVAFSATTDEKAVEE